MGLYYASIDSNLVIEGAKLDRFQTGCTGNFFSAIIKLSLLYNFELSDFISFAYSEFEAPAPPL